ncbi:major facilitator superfamily domain-containing protein [Rhexocercosporidium sp. MPI-PUGE-AT-0058]|nr:major facilitator superfamily domain-containing protein [Rhexocercosporidium sp. MPI-PUGE-AT-0058]
MRTCEPLSDDLGLHHFYFPKSILHGRLSDVGKPWRLHCMRRKSNSGLCINLAMPSFPPQAFPSIFLEPTDSLKQPTKARSSKEFVTSSQHSLCTDKMSAPRMEEPKVARAEADIEKAGPPTTTTDKPESKEDDEGGEEEVYPPWKRVAVIMIAVYCTMFIVALDRTILGTAIPKITDEFHSINDVGWYASSYLITSSAFQLIYGRIYTFYSPKWVLLGAIGLFELGSVICGTAPNSIAFIIGRAVAGLGSAGIFSGVINIMVITIPLHKRPMFQGIFGAVFGIASVAGPLVGGAFTTKLTWRWCFYINLPIGGLVAIIILFVLQAPPSKNTDTIRQQIRKLDPLGTSVFLPGIVCLLLALQWGGAEYHWQNARIIALFILAGILLGLFIFVQFRSGDNATVPIRIVNQRSILSGMYFSLVTPGSMMVIIYFLPIWFQAIKGVSAVTSGIHTLPLVFSLVAASIIAGGITAKTGYYTGQLIACSFVISVGTGLLTTLQVDTPSPKWIAYQFLYGFGLGLGMQQAGMAAQTCLAKKDVMIGVSLMFFMQGIGGSIFVSVGQTVFTQSLISKLSKVADISVPPAMIVRTGATELRNIVPPQYLHLVLIAYNAALSDVFKVGVACATASIIGGLTMEWKSVKALKEESERKEAEKKRKAEEAQTVNDGTDAETERTVVVTPPQTAVTKEESLPVKEG